MSTNTVQVEREAKDVQKDHSADQDFGISNTALLNLEFWEQIKAIAFADDLLIAVKVESIREAKNIANIEINIILTWAKNNKINFSEQKSKAIIISCK
jgi:predicted DNA-binding ribbon-helix-helix protein